jgi:hypothetical protein
MGRVLVIGVFLALAAVGCGGRDERSEAEKIRSVEEELSTLPDVGPGLGEASPPPGLRAGWETDFSKHSVSFDEFMSGGPGKDGIPAVDDPRFVAVEDADFLEDREPVIELVVEGEARLPDPDPHLARDRQRRRRGRAGSGHVLPANRSAGQLMGRQLAPYCNQQSFVFER